MGEEVPPVSGAPFDEVQSMGGIGDDSVDVYPGHCRTLGLHCATVTRYAPAPPLNRLTGLDGYSRAMAMDVESVKSSFGQAVPMVNTLGLEFIELDERRAVMVLPDQPAYHNHVAGPHAGAMFTLGESASGALVFVNFGDRMADATPLAVEATIRYLRFAKGRVTATATLSRDPADISAELDEGRRPEFSVDISITTDDGTQTGAMSVLWTLKPTRR